MPGPDPRSEWDAQTYHRVSNPQFSWGLKVLARLPLEGGETVLDAGCGSGRLTGEILERLPRGTAVAVDASQNMLDEARAHLAPRFGERVRFLRTDLLELDLEEAVDVVFSTATFHWVLDHARLFRVLHRALRPGGRLHAQCGGVRNLERIHERAHALMSVAPFVPYFAGWTDPWYFADVESTTRRLANAGFEQIRVWLEEAPTSFPDGAAYGEFLRAVVLRHHLARLPDQALQARYLESLVRDAARDNPPHRLDYWRLNIEARRS